MSSNYRKKELSPEKCSGVKNKSKDCAVFATRS